MSSESARTEGTDEAVERMSAQDPKTTQQPKAPERGKVSRDAEIELIKRQLSQLIHRVDDLKRKTA
jgi:hypothetical protein